MITTPKSPNISDLKEKKIDSFALFDIILGNITRNHNQEIVSNKNKKVVGKKEALEKENIESSRHNFVVS